MRVLVWAAAIAAYALLAVGGFVVPVLVDEAILAASDMSPPGELLPVLIVVVGLAFMWAAMWAAGMLFSLATRPGQPVKGSMSSLDGTGAGLGVFCTSACVGIGVWLRPHSPVSEIWFVAAGLIAVLGVMQLTRSSRSARSR